MIKNKEEFNNFFESSISPKYENGVSKTNKNKQKQIKLATILVFILFFIIQIIPRIWGPIGMFIFFILFIIAVSIYIYRSKPFSKTFTVEDDKKEEILNSILSKIAPSFSFNNKNSITRDEFVEYAFIPPTKNDHFESSDCIIGTYNGFEMKISECKILEKDESRDRTRYVRVFSGLIMEMEINTNQDFQLIITDKDFQSSPNIFSADKFVNYSKNLEEVSLSNVYLDENYFILTNDLIKTNKILEPSRLENLSKLLESDEHKISIGFSNGKFVAMINNDSNFFEIYEEGKFDPDVIWEEIINVLKYIKRVNNLGIDFSELR
jgi:hypothetical protein